VPEPQQVARLEVGANRAGSLRGLEHAGHRLAERVLAVPPERLGLPVDRRLQRRGQAGTLDDEPHQRLLRRQLLRERARLARELLDLAALDGLSEHVARREVPIERAGADAGALGDVVQRRVDALLEEDLAGGGHDPLVALPRVRADLGFTPADLSSVMNAYSLVFGGLLLLGGRLGDLFGRRRVFLAGVAVCTVASLACGLADSAGGCWSRPGSCGPRPAAAGPSTIRRLGDRTADVRGGTHFQAALVVDRRDQAVAVGDAPSRTTA
jgi:hypothetical protein